MAHLRRRRSKKHQQDSSVYHPEAQSTAQRNAPDGHMSSAQALQQIQHHPTPDSVMSLQRTIGNRATQQLLQREDGGGEATAPALDNKTGFLGMNPMASKEAQALKKRLSDDVIISLNDPKTEAELSTATGVLKWIMDVLGVNPIFSYSTFFGVYDAMMKADPSVRDQLGHMMKMFYGAQKGKYRLERLVMSGHSNGVALWGEAEEGGQSKSQIILDSDLRSLVNIFPKARDQIQDVMFSACWSVVAVDLVADLFPNLLTIWSYTGSSPSVKKGSIGHILGWERETRGDKELDAGDKRGKSALWVRGKGYLAGDPADFPVDKVEGAFDTHFPKLEDMLLGSDPLHREFCNMFYMIVQVIKIHPHVGESYKKQAEELVPKILRLRYWDLISKTFVDTYSAEIKAMYTAIGRTPKSLSGLGRPEFVAEIDEISLLMDDKTPNAVKDFVNNVLILGIIDLNETVIPNTWI